MRKVFRKEKIVAGAAALAWIGICLAAALWGAKSPRAEWAPDMAGGALLLGSGDGDGAYHVDETCGARGDFLVFEGISLKKGNYRVYLEGISSSDGYNQCYVSSESVSAGRLLDSGMYLYADAAVNAYEFELKEDVTDLRIAVTYCGMGELTVTGLRIAETYAVEKRRFWSMLFLGACAAGVWLYGKRKRAGKVSAQSGAVLWGAGAIILAVSVPLATGSLISGTHLQASLARIEAFYDGLCQGMFPVRLSMAWQEGYAGDGVSGDVFLLIPAVLRCMGFSLQASYKLYLILLNAATCAVAYLCFRKITGNRTLGLLCSMLYTLSVYRIYRMYNVGAVGETAAIVFLPLIVLGVYRLYHGGSGEHRKAVGLLLAGFTGLFQSNMVYWMLACGFVFLYALLMWKKGLTKSVWIAWGQTTVLWVLANLWFLIPAAAAWRRNGYFVPLPPGERGSLQAGGLYLAQLLNLFPEHGGKWQGGLFAGSAQEPAGLGFSLIFAAAALLYLIWTGTVKGQEKYSLGVVLALAGAGCLASMAWFPWDTVMAWNGKMQIIVGMLRTPVRFLAFPTVFLTLIAGYSGTVLKEKKPELYPLFVAGMLLATLCSSLYLLSDLTAVSGNIRVYTGEGLPLNYKQAVRLGEKGTAAGAIAGLVSLGALAAGILWSMCDGKKKSR